MNKTIDAKKIGRENVVKNKVNIKKVSQKKVGDKKTDDKKSQENSIFKKMTYSQKSKFLGEIVGLALRSELHGGYRLKEIFNNLLQPINKNQFRVYKIKNRTVGIVTWAYLSDKKQEEYLNGNENIKPNEWNCGKNLVITDFLAPFGHAKEIVKDLRINIFPNRIAKARKVKGKGKVKSVQSFYGEKVRKSRNTSQKAKA